MNCRFCGSNRTYYNGRMKMWTVVWWEEKEVYTCRRCGRNTVKTVMEREATKTEGDE